MVEITDYTKLFHEHGIKYTKIRHDILTLLIESNEPLSIKDIADKTKNCHFVSIYRSVDSMNQSGILKLVPRGFKNLFEPNDDLKPHHHHLVCEKCNRTLIIDNKLIEDLIHETAVLNKFTPTKHYLEIYGYCDKCNEK